MQHKIYVLKACNLSDGQKTVKLDWYIDFKGNQWEYNPDLVGGIIACSLADNPINILIKVTVQEVLMISSPLFGQFHYGDVADDDADADVAASDDDDDDDHDDHDDHHDVDQP